MCFKHAGTEKNVQVEYLKLTYKFLNYLCLAGHQVADFEYFFALVLLLLFSIFYYMRLTPGSYCMYYYVYKNRLIAKSMSVGYHKKTTEQRKRYEPISTVLAQYNK